jgi:hypothetical protein
MTKEYARAVLEYYPRQPEKVERLVEAGYNGNGPVGKQVVRFTAPCTLGAATSNTLAMQLITDGPNAV